MGWCGTSPAEASRTPCSRQDCEQIGADYYEEQPDVNCLVLSALNSDQERHLVGALVYPPLLRLRDEILPRSRLGRSILTEFNRHRPEAVEILKRDERLLNELIEFMMMVQPFVRAILGEDISRSAYPHGDTFYTYTARRVRPGMMTSLVHLMDRFAEQASDPFRHSLEAYGRLLPRFENLRPQKVSAALRRTDLSVPEPP
jgi:hypothetical protein